MTDERDATRKGAMPSNDKRRNDALNLTIGEHMRWIREAYEDQEPLHHGVNQWAEALGVSAAMLSRVERGEQTPSIDLLNRFCYFSGASLDFVFWRVLVPHMDQWLIEALRKTHPTRVVEMADFLSDRAMMLRTKPLRRGPRQRRRRRTHDDEE
jgi:transcriptional regulator with XRE-family HTH domain